MDANTKKAILKNRVKLLTLDYFDLTGPLLAAEVLPLIQHKEIKGNAGDSKARVDLLLDWFEESAPKNAFPLFLQGIRNCNEGMLAKRIKKEAGGEAAAPPRKPKAAATTAKKPTTSTLDLDKILANMIPPLPSNLGGGSATIKKKAVSSSSNTPNKKQDKPKKQKKPKNALPPGATSALLNGLPPPPPVTTTTTTTTTTSSVPKKRKADDAKIKLPKGGKNKDAAAGGGGSAPTPSKKAKGTPKGKDHQGGVGGLLPTPKSTASAAAEAAAAAAAAAAAIMAATPRTTRKSSSSDIVQVKGQKGGANKNKKPDNKKETVAGGKKGAAAAAAKGKKGAAGSSSAKAAAAAATGANSTDAPEMTFKAVEEKQQDFKNKFKFVNRNANARSILFKDKSDITYLGCPFMANNKMCGKKVELKSKEFICEAKHKSPNCRQIPRLQVTCNDGTGDLVLTLMKQNVEIFTGKSETDIETMSVDEIKSVLDKTTGKKMAVEVASEKAKKQGIVKKGTPPRWNNVATILLPAGGGAAAAAAATSSAAAASEPANKKKRK